ncbi:UBP-type zinc finger domain-containing protein [Streptomyces sp. NPDC090022]|uniref:UBP-type zinc finger domain-containing protein n=1 Tax=Streptomyces sp. NPDC090022 TaxID=3365920 RepID=UPI003824BF35
MRPGGAWVHLRLCLTCGHVGRCDSSPVRHAREHAAAEGDPIVRSFERGEDWLCDGAMGRPGPGPCPSPRTRRGPSGGPRC